MNEKDALLRTSIHYYCLEGFYQSMQNAALEGTRIYQSDHKYRFYYAISLAFEGRYSECIRELEALIEAQDLVIAVLLALINTHKSCKSIDKEEVNRYEAKLREKRKTDNEMSLYFAGLYLMLIRRHEKAKDYIERLLKLFPNSKDANILKGFNELMNSANDKPVATIIISYFDVGIKSNDPEAIMGKAKFLEKTGAYLPSIETLNQLIVTYTAFLPPLFEKIKLESTLCDWEQVIDCCNRVLVIDKHCIQAQRYIIIYNLIYESNNDEALAKLKDLITSLEIREAKNARIYYETAKLISRLTHGNEDILNHTFNLTEKAALLDPSCIDYILELGYEAILLNKLNDAKRYYKNALKLEENNVHASIGNLHCIILENNPQALDECSAIEEMHRNKEIDKRSMYLLALCAHKFNKDRACINDYIEKIYEKHIQEIKTCPIGLKYYIELDPLFIMDLANLYLDDDCHEPLCPGQQINNCLKKVRDILFLLITSCPNLKNALYLLAKVYYLSGDSQAALCYLDKCLDSNQAFSDGHLLKAKILVHEHNYQAANQSLESALSYNFEIRENLEYILVRIELLKHSKQYHQALKILQNVYNLNITNPEIKDRNSRKILIGLKLVQLYSFLNDKVNASQLIEELLDENRGTVEECKILLAKADLSEIKGDIEEALSILRDIPANELEHFIKSREKMAYIYHKYRKDRRLYASCYLDILEKNPVTHSYLLLGDAYMDILEPEKAIEIYEQALRKNPKDGFLARKVGQALMKAHQFEKAITYYKAAMKTSPDNNLKYDLCLLLWKMKRYKEAQDAINNSLEKIDRESKDLSLIEWESKMVCLLAQIQMHTNKKDLVINTLQKAYGLQLKVLRRISIERPDCLNDAKKLAIEICMQLSNFFVNHNRDHKKAVEICKDVLNFDPSNITILKVLAKLEMSTDNFQEAHKYLSSVLKLHPNDDDSLLMTADLMLRRHDFNEAMQHYKQLLDDKPNYYSALVRLTEAARRTGSLDNIREYIEKADFSSKKAISDAGLNYTRGLFYWYTGETNEAIKYFNRSRMDNEFKLMSTYHMIEIFINPEKGTIGGEIYESINANFKAMDNINAQDAAIKTAEKLLSEIRDKASEDIEYQLLCNFVLLYRGQKNDIEIALNEFLKIYNDTKYYQHVGALLGISAAYKILKQTQKARTHLKRVAKINWNFTDAEYLERCWLLLADIYIQSNKYESSSELLKKALQYNKSCTKAYEYLGFIMEKSSNFHDAIINYEFAWKLTNFDNPNIGYKLGINYLRAKRYTDAIDISRIVCDKFPDFSRIVKDVLEKARNNLKT